MLKPCRRDCAERSLRLTALALLALLLFSATASAQSPVPSPSPEPSPAPSPASAEDLYWQEVTKKNTPLWYQMYLREYPKGQHAADARLRIEKIKEEELELKKKREDEEKEKLRLREESLWAEATTTNTKESYAAYVSEFPSGRFVVEADARLVELKRLEEPKVWQAAEDAKTEKGYRLYLERYPEGEYAALARLRLIDLGGGLDDEVFLSLETSNQGIGPTTNLKIRSIPNATFTDEARQRGINGRVILDVNFLANGTIGAIKVVEALGGGLSEQAIAAARKISFEPAMRNGVPYSVKRRIQYNFSSY